MNENSDLLERAVELLEQQKAIWLSVAVKSGKIVVRTTGLDRVDVYLDGVPRRTSEVSDGCAFDFIPGVDWERLRVDGYRNNVLAARAQA